MSLSLLIDILLLISIVALMYVLAKWVQIGKELIMGLNKIIKKQENGE